MSVLFVSDKITPTDEQFRAIRIIEAEFGNAVVESNASARDRFLSIEGFSEDIFRGTALIRWIVSTNGTIVGGWVPNPQARLLTQRYQKGEYKPDLKL